MEMIFTNTENNKPSETQKFGPNLLQRLNLRSSNKTCFSSKLFYLLHMEKYKTTVQRGIAPTIIPPTWNDEFELPGGSYSVSDTQDYIEHIIKNVKHYPLIILFIFTSTRLIID